jgi:sugar/nucleoside kinase (ribokinase family)
MSLLVVGSVALDTVTTPHGHRENVLGGSCSFFSVGASILTRVRMVGAIGDDFPEEHLSLFRKRNIDLAGLERVRGGKTFRWAGRYQPRMDTRETLWTDLNVLGRFKPELPTEFRETEFLFLANGDPVTQTYVLDQMKNPRFVLLDTMNLWIDTAREKLLALLSRVDGLILNDEEARSLAHDENLISAMRTIRRLGPKILIVKKGEHGAVLLHDDRYFAVPAYPLVEVKDPTGAGDSFASGVMGRVAVTGDLSLAGLKSAMVFGTVVASFCVEDFSLGGLVGIAEADVERRVTDFTDFIRL